MVSFNVSSTGDEVVSAFSDRVKDKASQFTSDRFERWFTNLTVLITGPTPGGIGAETALALSRASPRIIILAGRSESKASSLIEQIKTATPAVTVRFVQLDLASQQSVRSATRGISLILKQEGASTLDLIINNGGVMMCPFALSPDGIESQFATNHIGHFLLTNILLRDSLVTGNTKGDQARIINVSSLACEFDGFDLSDVNFQTRPYNPIEAYVQSKLSNVLFSHALADRGLTSFSLHPGSIATNLQVHLAAMPGGREGLIQATIESERRKQRTLVIPERKTVQQGCATTLVAALDPRILDSNGSYLSDGIVQAEQPSFAAEDIEGLWKLSEELVGEEFRP